MYNVQHGVSTNTYLTLRKYIFTTFTVDNLQMLQSHITDELRMRELQEELSKVKIIEV